MTSLEAFGTAIVAKRRATASAARSRVTLILLASAVLAAGCYPRHDWREYRPDCARYWCGFVATFPGKPTSATRDIPVGAMRLPLTIHVASVDEVRFAVAAFELLPGADAGAARALLEKKLVDDVGASAGSRGTVTLRTTDRAALPADTFDTEGRVDGRALGARARFVERHGRLVEILVVGPASALDSDTGRQAVETFLTSLRLD